MYGKKQAGRIWGSLLIESLASLDYENLLTDECEFVHNNEMGFFTICTAVDALL